MQLKEGAAVVTADGKDVGTVDRVVLDPGSKKVTHLVVRQGFLFTEDKILPIDLVAQGDEDRVILRVEGDDLGELPPFEETHYIQAGEERVSAPYPTPYVMPVYWYPPVGTTRWGYPYPDYPGYTGTTLPSYAVEVEQNIPEGTVALAEGARVYSADGEHVGAVERVFFDPDSHKATHFMISEGLLFKERKLVPVAWTRSIGEDEVYLVVGSRLLDRLGEPKG